MNNLVTQARIVTTQEEINPGQGVQELALFNEDGTPFVFESGEITPASPVAIITTTNASDLATAIALTNSTKAKVNELIEELTIAGFISDDVL